MPSDDRHPQWIVIFNLTKWISLKFNKGDETEIGMTPAGENEWEFIKLKSIL